MKTMRTILTGALLAALGVGNGAEARAAGTLDLALARRVAAAGLEHASALKAPGGAIAVVDAGGHLVVLERLDDTFPAAASVSIEKARTAAVFKRPTKAFEEAIKGGRAALLGVQVMTPLEGGVPLVVDGQVVGAVGVSGAASADQDEAIAQAAARSVAAGGTTRPSSADVTLLPAMRVAEGFARGEPLLETGAYKVHASRREAPGVGEVHEHDTDIIYVLDGAATLVTGGTLTAPGVIAPGEVRGTGVEGGERRRLVKGDVSVVPAGVPHWFAQVEGPLLYYVVKVTEPMGATR